MPNSSGSKVDLYGFRPWHRDRFGRLAENHLAGKLHHALLLAGPPAMGKAIFAGFFAGFLLCERTKSGSSTVACGECETCELFAAETHPDFYQLEPTEDSRVIRIDQVRELQDKLQKTAQMKGNKVAIISPADQLNESAASALLKLLEEPPAHTYLLLIADRPQYVLPTIRSRCLPVHFGLPPAGVLKRFIAGLCDDAEKVESALELSRGFPELAINLLADGCREEGGDKSNSAASNAVDAGLLPRFLSNRESPGSRWLMELAKQPLDSVVDQLQREVHAGLRQACLQGEAGANEYPNNIDKRQWVALQTLFLQARQQVHSNPNAGLFIEMLLMGCRRIVSA